MSRQPTEGTGQDSVASDELDLIKSLASSVSLGRYHLVLGAGISYGCENNSGRLPMAAELSKQIVDELGFPDETIPLARAYESLEQERGKDFAIEFLRVRFANSRPQAWQHSIANFPWQAIWTFNVDDLLEFIYEGSDKEFETIVPSEPLRPIETSMEYVPIVHLHGYVGALRPKSDPSVVFSIPQYAAVARSSLQANWHGSFRTHFPTYPVIVIGAQLNEEHDIAEVLRYGNTAAEWGQESVIVRPDISEFEAMEYRRWGLRPVSMSAEQFFEQLNDALPDSSSDDSHQNRYTRSTFAPFDPHKSQDPRHDFYLGHTPYIQDIVNALDGVPTWIPNFVDELQNAATSAVVQQIWLLSGRPFTGKSTALIRIANELHLRGWQPFFLGGDEPLDAVQLEKFFDGKNQPILLVDNAAAEGIDLQRAIQHFRSIGKPLHVIAAERSGHATDSLVQIVGDRYVIGHSTTIFVEPTQALWTAIADVRQRKARMGILDGAPEKEVTRHFVTHDQDLFSALARLEDGSGFIDRITSVASNFSPQEIDALGVISLAAYRGLSATSTIISAAAGVRHSTLNDWINGASELANWVEREPGSSAHLRLRHRYIADIVLDERIPHLSKERLSTLMSEVCVLLADQVDSPLAISKGTYESRLVSSLMNRNMVMKVSAPADMDNWYEALQESYGWNARYWEQRALAISTDSAAMRDFRNLGKAYSFAERAISQYPDAMSHNTLGTVLMRRAVDELVEGERSVANEYWRKAISALKESRERSSDTVEHPYVTTFQYSRRILSLLPQGSPFAAEIRSELHAWVKRVSRTELSRSSSVSGLIQDVQSVITTA